MANAGRLVQSLPPVPRVTATDVAREAGVSRTTVSYVLNNRAQAIPERTRQRVLEVAAHLGYEPSSAARALATGRTNLVLGVFPDWPVGANFGGILRRLTRAFAAKGLVYLNHVASGSEPDLGLLWRTVSPTAVLIFDDIDQAQLDRMRATGVTVVVAVLSRSGRGRGQIDIWEEHVGQVQVQHLSATGHRYLGYAWPDDERLDAFAGPRLAGVRAMCAELGLRPPAVQTVPLTVDGAAKAIRTWRSRRPSVTSVCAYNDEVAIALLAGLRYLGLSAPDDLAVVGVDDIPTAALTNPPLTTVNYDRAGLAEFLASTVADAIEGNVAVVEPSFSGAVRLVRRQTT